MPTVACPSCGGVDDLEGRRSPDGVVVVHCGACGQSWQRDLTPTCTLCGSTDLEAIPTATLEEAGRGEQRTPSGIRDVYRCYSCGARDATSSSPVVEPAADRAPKATLPRSRAREEQPPASRRSPGTRRVESAFGAFAAGEVVGDRWRLEELVHWSSTGGLWSVREIDGDRQLLFKLVHPRLTTDRRRTALHAAAAHEVMGVRHPHLLPVLDVKTLEGHVLVVAQAAGGAVLQRDSVLDPDRLLEVAVAIGGALARLHERKVAHLDVRPQKILVARDGRPLLIDLGAGRARAGQRGRESSEHRLAFRAPEQVLAHDHGPAADVYSLGLTLWSLAGGDLRRMGPNADAQASYRLTHDVPALDPAATRLPVGVVQAIAEATRRPVQARPTTVEFVDLLRAS